MSAMVDCYFIFKFQICFISVLLTEICPLYCSKNNENNISMRQETECLQSGIVRFWVINWLLLLTQ